MPRFFFHLHEYDTVVEDEEGVECVDLAAARNRAITAARAIMSAEVLDGRLCLDCRIAIHDAAGSCVDAIAFSDAVAFKA